MQVEWRIVTATAWIRAGLAGLSVVLVLSGCAGRPRGVLVPVETQVAGTTEVDMLVATTRKLAEDRGVLFSGDRGTGLAYADITVSIPPASARSVGEVQWPSRLPGNPATDFVTTKAEALELDEARSWFRRTISRNKQRKVLLFVHGYNNRFEEAVYRFAQIVHDSGAPTVPVLFTWPSRGRLLDYNYDRESTTFSRDALEQVLQAMARDPMVSEVSVLAHSMGNWVTLEALRQMAIRNGRVHPKIRDVMLAAPDVDVDVFRRQVAETGASRPKFTLFVSQDDRALALSSRLAGGVQRLGAIDPNQEPFRTELEREKITVLDLTQLRGGDALNHGKFAESPQVVKLIGQRLIDGQAINDPNVGLGERIGQVTTGAAATVGSAAGLILSAPVAIIDPDTRENLGGQFESFGNTLGDTVRATGDVVIETPRQIGRNVSGGRPGAAPAVE